MATATATKPRTRTTKKAKTEIASVPPLPPTPPAAPTTTPGAAPIGSVVAKLEVSMGLVNFTAAARGAVVKETESRLSMLHSHEDGTVSPVRQSYGCSSCDFIGAQVDFDRGQKKGDGYVVVPRELIEADKSADAEHKGKLTITVHETTAVSLSVPSGTVYYLAPEKAKDHYATLAAVIAGRPDLTFVGVMATRQVAARYVLTSDGRTITLQQMADPEAVRERPVADVDADPTLLSQLNLILDGMVQPFDARSRASKVGEAVTDYVAAHDAAGSAVPDGGTATLDLAAQLQAQMDALVLPITAAPSKRGKAS